ncbi:MAG TPA: C39 family peptidase, partial [Clostridiales bacterium]|nr:C39 family peptidase [Clostridiales bacterium]
MNPFYGENWRARLRAVLCVGILPTALFFATPTFQNRAWETKQVLRPESAIVEKETSETAAQAEEADPSADASETEESAKKEPAAPMVKDIQGKAKPVATPKSNASRPKIPSSGSSSHSVRLSVPYVSQLPTYPTRCEAASATMLLQYYGYSVSLTEMVNAIPRQDLYKENGKVYGPDITQAFVGDPRQRYTDPRPGYGVFAPALTRSIQQVVNRHGGDHIVQNISGCSFDEMLRILDSGHPLIVWATYKMKVPTQVNAWYIKNGDGTDRYFEYPRGTHVMILSGYDASTVTVVDPYGNGVLRFNRKTFYDRWV